MAAQQSAFSRQEPLSFWRDGLRAVSEAASSAEGFQPRPFEAGVQIASTTISLEAVSTAFFARPIGVYAGVTDRLIFDG